ncbi:MAG: hypothetical protein IKT39_00015 [Clostridia bacterium]|nr:hypothetical protein [Clostridia bacterium]
MKKNLIFIFAILVTILTIICIQQQNIEFDKKKWDKDIYNREKMIDDFLLHYDLKSMSYNEVVAILGTSGTVSGSHISYYIGKSYSGPVILSITFDENDMVKSFDKIVD